MSEAYRSPGTAGASSLVVRYVCLASWLVVVALVTFAALFGWVISTENLDQAARHAPLALAFLALVVLIRFPLITIRARIEGGHLVVSGRRWPGAETIWSCTLVEAARFEEQTMNDPRRRLLNRRHYRRVALRTSEDQVLGLTHLAYPSTRWPYPRVVARLNAWLESQRQG